MPECKSGHTLVARCDKEAKYLLFSCRWVKGLPICANAVEDPKHGLEARWRNQIDEHKTCVRCGREVRYCWSWIPI